MYLVELKPGKEELYRTGDDLALAIRDGDVDARSRIYHRATAKWISITLHPQYKAIVAGLEDAAIPRPVRKGWGLLANSLSGLPVVDLSTPETPLSEGTVRHRWTRPMGFGTAGVLLLLGIQLAQTGPRPPWAAPGKPVAIVRAKEQRSPRITPALDAPAVASSADYSGPDVMTLASSAGAWRDSPVRAAEAIAGPAGEPAPLPVLPRAPRLRAKALRAALTGNSSSPKVKANSVEAILRRYEAASDEARARLERGMRIARLTRLFGSGRLAAGGGVTDTRRGLAGAANFIRVYREEQAAIEQAYQDTVTLTARRHKWAPEAVAQWSSRPQRKEAPTLQLLSGALLAGVDSILGVLDAQAGAYKVRGTAIAFEDPGATQAYGTLRKSIKEQIEAAVAAGGATSFGPTGILLQAIGTSTLPRET